MEKRSALTTLCYMEKDGCYLMMHRVRKKQDVNAGKWIGVGGHFEENESPEECLVREVREETGLRLETWRFRGIVTFMAKGWPTEYMCLFTADAPEGEVLDCEEGELCWIPKGEIMNLNLWEGDRIFLRFLLEEHGFFSLKLEYDGDRLERAVLDGKELEVTGQTKERDVLEVGDER
ncbi:MAG: NUDIX hydrolase [Clostridium sp.]